MKNKYYLILLLTLFITLSCRGKEQEIQSANKELSRDSLTQDSVLSYILNLPEIQNLSDQLRKTTNREHGAATIISQYNDSTDQIKVGSDMPDRFNTIFIFYYNKNTGQITVSSEDREMLLSLEEWKYNYSLKNKTLNKIDENSFYQLLLNLTSIKDFTKTLRQRIKRATIGITKIESNSDKGLSYIVNMNLDKTKIPLFTFNLNNSNNEITVSDLVYKDVSLKDWNNIYFDPTYQVDLFDYIDNFINIKLSQLPFDQLDFLNKCSSTENSDIQNADYCSKYIRYYFSENLIFKEILKKQWSDYDFDSFFLFFSTPSFRCYLVYYSKDEGFYKYMLLVSDGKKIISFLEFRDKTLFEVASDKTINIFELKYSSIETDDEGNEYIEGTYKGDLIEQYKIDNLGVIEKIK